MSNSNRANNKRAMEAYRKQLMAMFEDITEIDIRILNKAVNVGVADVKKNTPSRSGHMRRSWRALPAMKIKAGGVSKVMVNTANHSVYVNYGHRIVNKAGETIGFVKGRFMLDHAIKVVERQLSAEFKKEVEKVNREHDK